jgi:nucleoid DNA-binding protein
MMRQKINKNEFLQIVATKNDIDPDIVKNVYSAIVSEIKDSVCSGQDVSLTGFGTFSLKKHKGHPVQFEAKVDTVTDYVVLKFTVSDVLMTRIREAYSKGEVIVPDKSGAKSKKSKKA